MESWHTCYNRQNDQEKSVKRKPDRLRPISRWRMLFIDSFDKKSPRGAQAQTINKVSSQAKRRDFVMKKGAETKRKKEEDVEYNKQREG